MIYLDNSATTKPRAEVLDTFVKASNIYYANPASLHRLGNEAEDLLESARKQLQTLLGYERVVFTSGGTEANNLALRGAAFAFCNGSTAYSFIHDRFSAVHRAKFNAVDWRIHLWRSIRACVDRFVLLYLGRIDFIYGIQNHGSEAREKKSPHSSG